MGPDDTDATLFDILSQCQDRIFTFLNDGTFEAELIECSAVTSLMTKTNAFGWGLDDFDLLTIEFCFNYKSKKAFRKVLLDFVLTGDQDPEAIYAGTEIAGTCILLATENDFDLTEVEAEIVENSDLEDLEDEDDLDLDLDLEDEEEDN